VRLQAQLSSHGSSHACSGQHSRIHTSGTLSMSSHTQAGAVGGGNSSVCDVSVSVGVSCVSLSMLDADVHEITGARHL
jgi:hypothetical protein